MALSISTDIRAAANRALMAGSSKYFSWSTEKQERFRAAPGRECRCRMEQVLLKQVLGIKCSATQAPEVWGELSLDQLNRINPADLLTRGIGQDFVYLNESMGEGESLLDFDTLYDYDYDNFLFQEEWRHRELKDYVSPGYFPLDQPRWLRLVMNEELVYGNLFSVASYVISRVAESGDRRLDELIPSAYVEGPNHGKQEDDGVLWDYQLDAGGLEPQLEELRRRWWGYQQSAELGLQWKLADTAPRAYILHDESPVPDEVNINFVIQNEKTMRRVRWRAFLADLSDIDSDRNEVEDLITREKEAALRFIAEQYADIRENYIPPVISPGKERKLIISNGALDDLHRLSDDPEDG
ncbi:MAG: hypothetical protein SV429_04770 [Pseudomonadota bacterium]|nr:hypothetical protein [Pseudomonadota bacterium]